MHADIFSPKLKSIRETKFVDIVQWYSFSNSWSCHFLQKQEHQQDQQKLENKQHKKERDQLLSEIDRLEKLMKDTKNALEDQQRKNFGMFLYLLVYM